jgi:hypothetical protein
MAAWAACLPISLALVWFVRFRESLESRGRVFFQNGIVSMVSLLSESSWTLHDVGLTSAKGSQS